MLGRKCAAVALVWLAAVTAGPGRAAAAAAAAASRVAAGCVGVDRLPAGDQIRIAFRTDGPDGTYRASLTGPQGVVHADGRVASGLGLVLVAAPVPGSYADLLLTEVDGERAVDVGPLASALPVNVGDQPVPCDASSLSGTPSSTGSSTTTRPVTGSNPTRANAAAAGTRTARLTHPGDAPPWFLLAVPGFALVAVGVVLLVRARPGPHSRRTT